MSKRFHWALSSVLFLPALASAAPFVWSQPEHLRLPVGADEVAAGDFNGDGRDDLALVVQGHLEVRLQGEDGGLMPSIRFEVPSATFYTVHVEDLGADGSMQILVGHGAGLTVYTWNGSGSFRLSQHPGEAACRKITTGDVNGDGAPDAFCLGHEADAMLYFSDPAAVLGDPVALQTAARGAGVFGQARLKDVTGDGRADLLLASGLVNSFFIYPNDGNRGFLPGTAYTYPEEAYLWSHAIEVLDLERDGRNEVVVTAPCNMPCARLHFYRQGANGYLELARSVPTLDIPDVLLSADINSDGYGDLLVGHRGWSTVGRYMGNAQGLGAAELWSSVPVQRSAGGIALGDLNNDDHIDLVVANSFGASVLQGGLQAASDLDGDFASDLVWRNAAGENRMWKSADSTAVQVLPSMDANWSAQAMGDFDGDGLLEIFWRHRGTGENAVWSGGLTNIEAPATVSSQDWQVVGAGEFDGDGRWDLLWRNSRTGANAIWKSANIATQQATASVPDQAWKVAAIGDFDGDRRSDILWRHEVTGSNSIWRSGRSDLARTVATVANLQWKVAGAGDFNGDGTDDVLWRNFGNGTNAVWLSGDSARSVALTPVSNLKWKVGSVADFNGDGKADLLWRYESTGANTIWRSGDSRQVQDVTSLVGWQLVR